MNGKKSNWQLEQIPKTQDRHVFLEDFKGKL